MAANNYFGFAHGGAQYGAAATGAAYPTAQPGYAVTPAATAATYGTQRAASTAYDTAAYQAAATQGTYATTGAPATYDYGYGRAATTYDASKTYYQQAGATAAVTGYTAPAYDANAAKPAYQTTVNYTTQAAAPRQNTNQAAKAQYVAATQQTAYAQAPAAATQTSYQANNQAAATQKQNTAAATANSTAYTGYDAALYSATTMFVAQQQSKGGQTGGQGGWQGYPKKGGQGNQGGSSGHKSQRPKQPPKPQQLHYCDVCRISCAGPQTYREHLEGQKHKKREASLKLVATVSNVSQGRAGNALRCELCDVTCTGNDAYAAHVRGAKHQKVVKLHTKLGKPIPSQEPQVLGKKSSSSGQKINFVASGNLGSANSGSPSTAAEENTSEMETDIEPDIQPVGQDYIEEMKGDDGKVLSFNCKLCDCRFNDPNAKEMHMKGRRHRLQYKKKVQPDLVVDVKPSLRQRKLQEAKSQRAAMREEFWARRRMAESEMEEEERLFWEERRRYEDECDYYLEWCRRGPGGPFPGPPRPMMGRPGPMGPMHPFFGMAHQGPRRPDSNDDKHVLAKHAEIYPKEEELQIIQRIVSHTERALKFVSDALADQSLKNNVARTAQQTPPKAQQTPTNKTMSPTETPKPTTETKAADKETDSKKDGEKKDGAKEDGRDNQLFSFQRDADASTVRVLKGVMRVGLLAKGLLLQGDNNVQLVVLCAEKPTSTLLKKVFQELPIQLKKVSEEHKYKVSLVPIEAGITISDGNVTVLVSLTSPLMRDQADGKTVSQSGDGASNQVNAATATPNDNSPADLLPRQKCLDALAALRHAKWFQARATPLNSCVIVIRILRDLCQRVPTWAPLNSWAMELLVEKVLQSAGMALSPGECLRRILECLAGGILLNGPGILDPCEKESQDALGNLSSQQREDLTVSAQQYLRQLAFRQIHKILGMDPIPITKNQRVWRFTRKRRRSGTEATDAEGDGKMVKKENEKTETVTVKMETTA